MREVGHFRKALKLNHSAASAIVRAAADHAAGMGQPQCIAVVDEGCNLLAFLRMDGGRVLSIETAQRKAATAASTGLPSGSANMDVEAQLAVTTVGRFTALRGGLPIIQDGQLLGGIGVGSGNAEQDVEVARAGLRALGGNGPETGDASKLPARGVKE